MLTGLLIAWAIATPLLSAGLAGDPATVAVTVWRTQVRFLGAGAIGVAAIWSLIKLLKPVLAGLVATARARHAARIEGQDDRDIPLAMIGLLTAVCLLMIGWLLYDFIGGTPLQARTIPLVLGGVLFTVVIGGFVATVAGYMAGLIGASNSPVSGIGILATVAVALLLAIFAQPALGIDATDALVAFALFTVAIVFSIATISNDNLQDLKTGQLVGASPWKQQVALIVGVVAGSLIIPPTLDLLNRAYGFPGDPNRAAISADPLPAPQAALISTLARGVLNAQLDWKMIGIGALVGLACIFLDEILGALKLLRL
jgi:putative OPT family oligopeptide transporter